MALGLESNIAETAKAFQGNPQALQQRYTQKQDLFDLLALNMIKKNQDAAKRSLMLSQQKMPGTVLEQVEGAVTKNAAEKVKGVAGALATKNAQTKARMNKIAGISGAPAPNMARMASGGIIGFADEGSVPKNREEQIRILRNKYSANLISKEEYLKEAAEIRSKGPQGPIAQRSAKKSDDLFFATTKNRQDDPDRSIISDKDTQSLNPAINFEKPVDDKTGENMPVGIQALEAQVDNLEGTGLGKLPAPNFGTGTGIDGAAITPKEKKIVSETTPKPIVPEVKSTQPEQKTDVSGIGSVAYQAPDYSKLSLNDPVKAAIKAQLEEDPQKAVDFQARTPAEQAFIDKMLKERMDMRANMMDPDKLSSDRLSQMLLGARGATAGEAFRTAGIAGINAERAQEKLRRSEFDALNKLYMDEANKSQKIKGDAFKTAQDVRKSATTTGGNLLANEQARVQGDAKGFFDASKANQTAAIKKAEIKSKEFVSQQNNKVRIDIANMEKGINEQKIKVQREANQIKKTQGEIDAARHILNNMETIINGAQKNITAAYDKQIKELDNPLGAGKGLEPAEIANKKAQLEKQKQQAIADRVADLKIDADYARKIILGRVSTKSGKKTSNMDEVDKILGIK
jgi:hypothetical protein